MAAQQSPEPFPGHDPGMWSPVPCRTVAAWPAGTFAENLVVHPDGGILVSLHSHNRIDRYDPATGILSPYRHLPLPVAGLACHEGLIWATGGTIGQTPGVVWRLGAEAGHEEPWAEIPDAVFLNGCTVHPAARALLVCESVTGRVLAIDLDQPGRWRPWLEDDRLRPTRSGTPGANGVKLRGQQVIVSVTDRDLLLHARLDDRGEPGPLQGLADHLRADDFAIAASGALYVGTHPANSVLRLGPDGSRTTLAGPAQGAVGATACAFGCGPDDAHALYVTTNGGLWTPYRGQVQDAKLLRLEVGESA